MGACARKRRQGRDASERRHLSAVRVHEEDGRPIPNDFFTRADPAQNTCEQVNLPKRTPSECAEIDLLNQRFRYRGVQLDDGTEGFVDALDVSKAPTGSTNEADLHLNYDVCTMWLWRTSSGSSGTPPRTGRTGRNTASHSM